MGASLSLCVCELVFARGSHFKFDSARRYATKSCSLKDYAIIKGEANVTNERQKVCNSFV